MSDKIPLPKPDPRDSKNSIQGNAWGEGQQTRMKIMYDASYPKEGAVNPEHLGSQSASPPKEGD